MGRGLGGAAGALITRRGILGCTWAGAARKLLHVWAATSEGAGPPLRLGDAKSSPSPHEPLETAAAGP